MRLRGAHAAGLLGLGHGHDVQSEARCVRPRLGPRRREGDWRGPQGVLLFTPFYALACEDDSAHAGELVLFTAEYRRCSVPCNVSVCRLCAGAAVVHNGAGRLFDAVLLGTSGTLSLIPLALGRRLKSFPSLAVGEETATAVLNLREIFWQLRHERAGQRSMVVVTRSATAVCAQLMI